MNYDWPGNVRQLQNALFRAAVLCDDAALTDADFPQIAALGSRRPPTAPTATMASNGGVTLYHADGNLRALEGIEADVIRLAIGHYRGRMTAVARRRSEEHTSELQSLMRISYAVFCLQNKTS